MTMLSGDVNWPMSWIRMSRLNGSLGCCAGDVSQHRSNWDYYDETIIFRLIHFPKIWFETSDFSRKRSHCAPQAL